MSPFGAKRLSDYRIKDDPEKILHSHSIDAAQEAFYKAIKTARTNRKSDSTARFPYKRKFYRTTIWKTSGIRRRDGVLLLSKSRGSEPIVVPFDLEGEIREVRLVFDLKQRRHFWHFVIEDGKIPPPHPGENVAAGDLGEIHPIALSDEEEACVISCRELRSIAQGANKNLARIQAKLSKCQKGSRRSKRLKRVKRNLLAKRKRRQRDLLHKVSRSAINWCVERKVGILAIGDVRDVADKTKEEKRLNRENRQKISNWPHGMLRQYLNYKAEESGIRIHDDVSERYTSQTCLSCGHRHKPKGRIYRCPKCEFEFARDGVGAANILSRFKYGELAKAKPRVCKYRRPFQRWNGLRSQADTLHVANAS